MTEIVVRKVRLRHTGHVALFPVDDDGREVIARIRDNRDVTCEVVQRRNPRHHRLYWGLVKFVSEHCDLFFGESLEHIHVAIKIGTGLVDPFIDETGRTFYVVRSIAWGSMDQSTFSKFFDDACALIATRWMPQGTTAESVRSELISMIDGEHAVGSKVL